MKKKIFATITSLAFVFTPIQGVEAAGFLARLFPGWSAARHSHNYSHRYGDSYGSSGGYSGYGSSGGSYSGTYGDSSGHYHYEYKKGKFTYEDESGNTVEQDAEMPVKVYGDAPIVLVTKVSLEFPPPAFVQMMIVISTGTVAEFAPVE